MVAATAAIAMTLAGCGGGGRLVSSRTTTTTIPALSDGSYRDYGGTNITDLDFVVKEALRRATVPGDLLNGLVDPARVAVTGHSDGEVLAYALGFEACCRDPRVNAIIAMAGDLSNANVLPVASGVPILHVMAENDEFDPYPGAIAFDREHLPAPKYSLTLRAAPHFPPFNDPGERHFDLVARATVDSSTAH